MNRFLANLVNTTTAPVNPSATTGTLLWPPLVPATYTGAEATVFGQLFTGCSTNLDRLVAAIQLLWLVENSVLVGAIAETDPQISYDEQQLRGQLTDIPANKLAHVTAVFAGFPWGLPGQFIAPDLRAVFSSGLSRLDRLAAVVVHYGRRDG